jgi:hypothetical protein
VPLTELDLEKLGKFAVVLGNEDRGISDEVRGLCDHKVYLPMRGFAQSFSLSVGCAAIASHLNAVSASKQSLGFESCRPPFPLRLSNPLRYPNSFDYPLSLSLIPPLCPLMDPFLSEPPPLLSLSCRLAP